MWLLGQVKLCTLRVVLGGLLRFFALFTKVESHLILFASFGGQSYSDNPRYIFEYLKEESDFKDYQFVWAFKDKREVEGAKMVRFNSLNYYYLLSKAKYWVFNAKMAPYYSKRREQIYLQTWHGTPLKRLAHDLVDDGRHFYRSHQSYSQMVKGYDRDRRHWDYLISANSFSTKVFESAFDFSEQKILEVGYPRVDQLIGSYGKKALELKLKYQLPMDKKVILYAPTWRDNDFVREGYVFRLATDFEKWQKKLSEKYIVLFKPHYLIAKNYQVPTSLARFVYVLDNSSDINDAYLMSDILVTDYSSVFFDFAVLNRPIYFYMYDFEQYEQKLRGFYLDVFKDLPNKIVKNEDELLNAIDSEYFDYQRLKVFNQRFNTLQDGQATQRVVRRVFLEG